MKNKMLGCVVVIAILVGVLAIACSTPLSELDCGDIVDNAVDASDNTGPFRSEILHISNVSEISHTDDRLTCRGTALLGNGRSVDVKFQSWVDDGKQFISYGPL